jgi:hypothetical protein
MKLSTQKYCPEGSTTKMLASVDVSTVASVDVSTVASVDVSTVETRYLTEIIRENQELKRMVAELLMEKRLREADLRSS